ncbi:unnamed protein product [Paramecium sonneborni]|uniref:Uncharacterized protein n=1 Tax=Paramecium sonneborni TaxID=65129 RepID=A0A8S1RJY5_9CILI|nr:unnamed protein product [Paramecium sonneborni]
MSKFLHLAQFGQQNQDKNANCNIVRFYIFMLIQLTIKENHQYKKDQSKKKCPQNKHCQNASQKEFLCQEILIFQQTGLD